MDVQRIKMREARMLRFERWYYAVRRLSNFLCLVLILGVVGLIFFYTGKHDIGEMGRDGIWAAVFFKLIASNAHARIQHCESIRYYQSNQ